MRNSSPLNDELDAAAGRLRGFTELRRRLAAIERTNS